MLLYERMLLDDDKESDQSRFGSESYPSNKSFNVFKNQLPLVKVFKDTPCEPVTKPQVSNAHVSAKEETLTTYACRDEEI